MTTVEFKPASDAWRGPGAPRIAIPQQLAEWMDKTHRENSVCELEAEEGDEDTEEFLRLLLIYARRKNKTLHKQFFDGPGGESMLRFMMRDKRPYKHQTTMARERR